MIITYHEDGIVCETVRNNYIPCFQELNGKSIQQAWLSIAESGYQGWLGWCDTLWSKAAKIENWSSMVLDQTTIISYEPTKSNRFAPELGYVFFDTPSLIDYPTDSRYPTWQTSTSAGCIHTSIVNRTKDIIRCSISFRQLLNCIAFAGHKQGLLTYSEPALLSTSHTSVSTEQVQTTTNIKEIALLLHSYATPREFIFFFIASFLYQKKLYLILLIKSLLHPKCPPFHPGELTYPNHSALSSSSTVDVLIPTLGRAIYLRDVVYDLTNQTILPQRVIIVEQLMPNEEVSNLPYLSSQAWPFEIVHITTKQLGACNARNVGLKHVEATWVFMADDDIRIQPQTLQVALERLTAYRAKAATMSVYQKDETIKTNRPIMWDSFGSGCSIVKSEIAKQIDFDMSLEFGYGEDKDYGIQIRKRGAAILYLTDCPIFHLKAPIGGFRQKIVNPWDNEMWKPKPSPTVMYYMMKNHSQFQQKGYKLYYLFNQLKSIRGLLNIRNVLKSWNTSHIWGIKLMQHKQI